VLPLFVVPFYLFSVFSPTRPDPSVFILKSSGFLGHLFCHGGLFDQFEIVTVSSWELLYFAQFPFHPAFVESSLIFRRLSEGEG